MSRRPPRTGLWHKWPLALATRAMGAHQGSPSRLLPLREHLEGAIHWLMTAQRSSCDGGIPAYYDLLRRRWGPSYPETTGYAIPTLLACAKALDRTDCRDMALELAEYLLRVRTPEGGVGHWKSDKRQSTAPVVFDTGQAIWGWLAAWRETRDPRYREAARRAADWLVGVQEAGGAWVQYQHLGMVKVIDTRVAWVLLELSVEESNPDYAAAASRNLDWALGQQLDNGWLRRASFRPGEDPSTHTIAYAAEGLLESGLLLPDPGYAAAGEKVARRLLQLQRPDGSLAGAFDQHWQPTTRSSCLTGNCQVALLWLRLHDLYGESRLREAAWRAIRFVAATQDLTTPDAGVRGAIAGSHPITGRYERFLYVNWAAKFFIDAVLSLMGVKDEGRGEGDHA